MTVRRYAVILNTDEDLTRVQAYMPHNYEASELPAFGDLDPAILISGYDDAGWTLDDYVIPRLASGLIWASEIHDPMRHAT